MSVKGAGGETTTGTSAQDAGADGKAAGQALLGMISSRGDGASGRTDIPAQAMSLDEIEGGLQANQVDDTATSVARSSNEQKFWEMLKNAGPAP